MPRSIPNERQAAFSAFARPASTGPTSQAAANSSAVLARITARYSSSLVAVFLAAASCITSPSAITAAAEDRIRARAETDLDHHLEGLAEQKIADQHARLVAPQHARGEPAAAHVAFVDHVIVQQCRRVHELDRGGELDMTVARDSRSTAMASVSIGRSRLPPDEIRWLATSGIIATSEPVRDRMVALTRSISGATSPASRSIEAG